ncbi:MAG: 8-amino-7-oxononanoate synthase [Psychrosphaera sp.]|nr:8-amino-7-oxononanoate synthase [Psychrosphaera sp.]
MLTGYSYAQRELEDYLCDWLGFDRCLLFNSGFAANTGVLQTLLSEQSLLVQDKLNHASLIDGGVACAAKSVRFRHNDMDSLQQRLQSAPNDTLTVTEGVFSMDGDTAKLDEIYQLTRENKSWLMIDDAHGIGVLGEQGKGTANHYGLSPNAVDIHMATFGKAVGTTGAFVGASKSTIEYLLQFCRHYIYSTAMPPAMAAATLASLKCLAQEQWRRDKLGELTDYFKSKIKGLGLLDSHSDSAIQPIIIGCADKTVALSESLKKQGIWLAAIRPPTVSAKVSRLRVTLTSQHETKDIDSLFDKLNQSMAVLL